MTTRRRFLSHAGMAMGGLACGLPFGFGQDKDRLPDGAASKDMINEPAQQAIDQGLRWLSLQISSSGFFGTGPSYHGSVAVTSLAALAFMSGGHLPSRGRYGELVTRALRYVMEQEDKSLPGFLHNRSGPTQSGMYNHGFGTLFLAEVHGTIADRTLGKEVRDLLKRAIQLILDSQNSEGGWRYQPKPREADISVTVCQIMALRAARNTGIDVPKSKVDRCIEYVKRCQDFSGGFRYMAASGHTAFARTAAGVCALQSAGIYKGREVERGLAFLQNHRPGQHRIGQHHMGDYHFFYGHYYAAQAMWTAGGRYWADWYPAIRDELIQPERSRRQDGNWYDTICKHYATAMACIILQIPNNYLPILQK